MHYSYESVVRIWNPELFHILARGPCLAEDMAVVVRLRIHLRAAGGSRRHPAAWPRLAMATPSPDLGRLKPVAAGARALALPCRWRALEGGRGREGEPGGGGDGCVDCKEEQGEASGVHIVSREVEARGSSTQQWWSALWCMAATQAFHRTRGARRSRQGGRRFSACSGRILRWAKNKVCSPRCALQLWLRVLSH